MVWRIAEPGLPCFQLRRGEEGLSVFDPALVDPPLSEFEVLAPFRLGSIVVARSDSEVESKGLLVVPIEGAEQLPPRVRAAHAEIRPGPTMSRAEYKKALRELE